MFCYTAQLKIFLKVSFKLSFFLSLQKATSGGSRTTIGWGFGGEVFSWAV